MILSKEFKHTQFNPGPMIDALSRLTRLPVTTDQVADVIGTDDIEDTYHEYHSSPVARYRIGEAITQNQIHPKTDWKTAITLMTNAAKLAIRGDAAEAAMRNSVVQEFERHTVTSPLLINEISKADLQRNRTDIYGIPALLSHNFA